MAHVIWDWNSTLFDDFHIIVEATSHACQAIGLQPIDVMQYHANHARPISALYEGIAQRSLTTNELETINSAFLSSYMDAMKCAQLARDAQEALNAVRNTGATQSLLSLWRDDSLNVLVDELEVREYFLHVQGLKSGIVEFKHVHMQHHVQQLLRVLGTTPDRLVMIGDTVDDAETARSNGADCVLVATGSDSRQRLSATGFPVANNLLEAIELGKVI